MPDIYYTEKVKHNEYAEWGRDPANTPYKSGYTFVGWKYKGVMYSPSEYAQINPFGPIREDVNISAVWREGQTGVRVTFNVARNNGRWVDNQSTSDYVVQTDGNIQLTDDRAAISQQPTESGFVGWSTDPTAEYGQDTFEVGENDTTVYAIFKEGETSEVIELEFNVDGEIAQFATGQSLRKAATETKRTVKALAGRPISYQSAALKPSDEVSGYEAIVPDGVSASVNNTKNTVTASKSLSLVSKLRVAVPKIPVVWEDREVYSAKVVFRVSGIDDDGELDWIWADGTTEDHEIMTYPNIYVKYDSSKVFFNGKEEPGFITSFAGWRCYKWCSCVSDSGESLRLISLPPNNEPIVMIPNWLRIPGGRQVCFQLDSKSSWTTGTGSRDDYYVAIVNGKATCDKEITYVIEPGKTATFKGWKCYKGYWGVTFEGLNTVVTNHSCIVRPVWEITEE